MLCRSCGSPLKEPRKLKDFCSYSCRGQHSVKALDGPKHQGAYLGAKNTRKTKALQRLRRASIAGIAFERINSVTIRIDQPYKKAVGWLTEVAWPSETKQKRWVARVGDRASESLPLEEAKRAATTMLRKRGKAEPRDWIKDLNQLAANEVERAYWAQEKRTWPLDLMGGQRHRAKRPSFTVDQRQAITETERLLIDEPATTLKGNDHQLEYYEDGYPKLPTCLDRCEAAA